jgi:hypothetical protein
LSPREQSDLLNQLFKLPEVRYAAIVGEFGTTLQERMRPATVRVTPPDQDQKMNMQTILALRMAETNVKYVGKLNYLCIRWEKIIDMYFLLASKLGIAVTLDGDASDEATQSVASLVKKFT